MQGAEEAEETGEALKAKVSSLTAQLRQSEEAQKASQERYIRLNADFDNFRKRSVSLNLQRCLQQANAASLQIVRRLAHCSAWVFSWHLSRSLQTCTDPIPSVHRQGSLILGCCKAASRSQKVHVVLAGCRVGAADGQGGCVVTAGGRERGN